MMVALTVIECSKGDDIETSAVNIQLSKTEVKPSVKEETNVVVSGVDISDYKTTHRQ